MSQHSTANLISTSIHHLHLHLSDGFIQSDVQLHSGYTFLTSMWVPWESNPQPLRCWRNSLPLSHTGTHHTNYSFIYKNSENNISWHHNPHISRRELWIFLISPAAPFMILLSQSLFLEHEPYLPSANPRLSTAGGAEGKQEGTREMSRLPVQPGNLPNHQPVIYLGWRYTVSLRHPLLPAT